jgi:hypothetical protein
MTNSWILRPMLGLGIASMAAFGVADAQPLNAPNLANVVAPRLSAPRLKYFQAHPAEWQKFVANLPLRPTTDTPTVNRYVPAKAGLAGGTWQTVKPAPSFGLCNPLLMTDGTVIVHNCYTPDWYKLTPDINGNYTTGTWSQIASMPVVNGTQYAPQYNASAVLPGGRVIVIGGEYNGGQGAVWTNLGAEYLPVANGWVPISAPDGGTGGWASIGDSESTVLADGTFLLGACCGYPDVDALFDAKTMTWTDTGSPAAGGAYQDEQGYTLLPSGNVLTLDIWTNYPSGDSNNAEMYVPKKGTWISAGTTSVSLPDPAACGTYEIGPAPLRGDGTVVQFGGHTGCEKPTVDPTAIYTAAANLWQPGPDVPQVCGKSGKLSCDLADAPAAVLPDGNILFAASAGYGDHPTHFFEFTAGNFIEQVADPIDHASDSGAYYYNFLVLPNGQILMTDFSRILEVYTPSAKQISSYGSTITKAPASVTPCQSYEIRGKQLSGRTQGAYYGDDAQAETNYPIVKIVNTGTGHVFYASTIGSTRSVEPLVVSTATFTVPCGIESGPSSLYSVANGITSKPVSVTVGTPG